MNTLCLVLRHAAAVTCAGLITITMGAGAHTVHASPNSPASDGKPTASSSSGAGKKQATPEQIAAARSAQAYWTPQKIADASPQGAPPTARTPSREAIDTNDTSSHWDDAGIPTAGVFLIASTDPAKPNQSCSASSLTSATKSLAITAAHCLSNTSRIRSMAFAPGWKPDPHDPGKGTAPFGVFPVEPGKVWIDGRYLSQGAVKADDLDFAVLRVGPNTKGQFLEDAAGPGNRLTTVTSTSLARKNVTLVGFPQGAKRPLVCTNATRGFKDRFLQIDCAGFAAGSSGGPFLENFDGQRGDLIGVIGGYHTGGSTPDISYSSLFGAGITRLYDQAVHDEKPDSAGHGDTLGNADLWRHATATIAGSFHTNSRTNGTSDLVVKWSDGEITLYPGNGAQGFHTGCQPGQPCEVQLAPPNTLWSKHAQIITAGNFASPDAHDLMVKWSDGEMSLFKGIGEKSKLPTTSAARPANEFKIATAGSAWKRAKSIVAGRYDTASTHDDLIVRWVDGEVTKHTGIDAKGFHGETRLKAPSTLWADHATVLAAGDFDSTAHGHSDLLVRWSDGELSLYADITRIGLGQEHTLMPPNRRWAQADSLTAGSFGKTHRAHDLLTHWSTGEVSLFANTSTTRLGQEHRLVTQTSGL